MAVKEGFEPSIRLHVWFLSRELVSATHPLHRTIQDAYQSIFIKIHFFKHSIDANDTSYAVGGIIAKSKRIASILWAFNRAFCIIVDLMFFMAFLLADGYSICYLL